MTEYAELAKECGFSASAQIDPSVLAFKPEVREMCAADKCHNYNKSWACPPACGSLEEIIQRCKPYTGGLIVQSTVPLKNSFDYESIAALQKSHSDSMHKMTDLLAESGADFLPMGAGSCKRCETCTWPDNPCRFPEKVFPSMEACGLMVSDCCKSAGIPYHYGANTMTFVGAFLFKKIT